MDELEDFPAGGVDIVITYIARFHGPNGYHYRVGRTAHANKFFENQSSPASGYYAKDHSINDQFYQDKFREFVFAQYEDFKYKEDAEQFADILSFECRDMLYPRYIEFNRDLVISPEGFKP